MIAPELLSRQLLDGLTASGELRPEWREAFVAVPRHRFIPELIWVKNDGGELVPLHRNDDPDEWMRRAYSPAAVITQVDDGNPTGPGQHGRYITSSASQPDVVAFMRWRPFLLSHGKRVPRGRASFRCPASLSPSPWAC